MKVKKLDKESFDLIGKIDSKMEPIQAELDVLNAEFQKAMESVNKVKDKIRPVKAKLSPWGAMKAGVASADSRDKYFPDMSKTQFMEYVKKQLS